MKERGIIFNDEMVRALLAGRKTQTRRIIKNQPTECGLDWVTVCGGEFAAWQDDGLLLDEWSEDGGPCQRICPYGRLGERLWVREAFGMAIRNVGGSPHEQIACRASKPDAVRCYDCNGNELAMKWIPPSRMPRWASRITLEITDVRVERLQEMTVSDAIAEGYDGSNSDIADPSISWFREKVWCNIHGPDSWAANPWVWVIEFKRVEAV